MRFSKKKILISVILIIIIIFFLNFFQKEIKNFFYFISLPIQKAFWRVGERASDFFEGILKNQELKKENEKLKFENQKLLAKVALLKDLKKENQFLREALNLGLEKEFKLILAEIISKDISEDLILINKGSEDKILEGMAVITSQKVLVGKIKEVFKNFSKVQLISHQKTSFDVEILEKDIKGVVKGKGNFNLFLDLIPLQKEISKEDIIVTSVLGGIFPKGLLVGKIREVQKSDIEPFQKAKIEPFFEIGEIEKVFIITKVLKSNTNLLIK
jgi:rod shape-determining protein MreC